MAPPSNKEVVPIEKENLNYLYFTNTAHDYYLRMATFSLQVSWDVLL